MASAFLVSFIAIQILSFVGVHNNLSLSSLFTIASYEHTHFLRVEDQSPSHDSTAIGGLVAVITILLTIFLFLTGVAFLYCPSTPVYKHDLVEEIDDDEPLLDKENPIN